MSADAPSWPPRVGVLLPRAGLAIAQNAEQNPGKIRGDPAQNLGKIGVLTEQNQAKSRSSPEQNLA
jgi:hypothetical protein